MLKKCSSALLLSDVPSFTRLYQQIADEADVKLIVESEWSDKYRVVQDVVILGSKYLDCLNDSYYQSAVLILKSGENPYPYMQKGISRFIFDHQNQYELFTALFRLEPVTVHANNMSLTDILKESKTWNFCYGDYDFKFDKDRYWYKGKPIYLGNSQKRYLAEWLLNGHKDNRKRMLLCDLRKKFGADFLKNVDRFGEIKEEKDE